MYCFEIIRPTVQEKTTKKEPEIKKATEETQVKIVPSEKKAVVEKKIEKPVVKDEKKDEDELFYEAIEKYQLPKYRESRKLLEEAIKKRPGLAKNSVVQGMLADTYLYEGNFKMAAAKYSEAIKLGLNSRDIYYNRGVANLKSGNNLQGLKDLLKSGYRDPDAWFWMGYAYHALKDEINADKAFTKVIEGGNNNNLGKAYFQRGIIHEDKGQLNEAQSDLEKAYKQKDTTPAMKDDIEERLSKIVKRRIEKGEYKIQKHEKYEKPKPKFKKPGLFEQIIEYKSEEYIDPT